MLADAPAIVILIRQAADAAALTSLLDGLRTPGSRLVVTMPDVRGIDFFAA
ncbi:MAG: hypothetical protein JOY68_06130, partial [Candidatus Dormibacteraeota bacterium]|nr:hypothetical protein [Candidatus Dormibacteraeota bacterium]